MHLEENHIIKDLLSLKVTKDGSRSCLTMALKSARRHTGRNPFTADFTNSLVNDEIFESDSLHSEYFTGLTIYLILLEQIGCIFKKKGYNEGAKSNGIRIALENFSKSDKDLINAIRALRDSLVHNFGLTNSENPRSKNKGQLFKFTLLFNNSTRAILPNLKWSGDYNDINESNNSIVGVQELCELVESVFLNLVIEFEKDNVELRIKNINELKARFTIL